MAYNSAKLLYVIYNRKTHEYFQNSAYQDFGNFETCQLFTTENEASSRITKNRLSGKGLEILEIELTKWQCKEIIPGRTEPCKK